VRGERARARHGMSERRGGREGGREEGRKGRDRERGREREREKSERDTGYQDRSNGQRRVSFSLV